MESANEEIYAVFIKWKHVDFMKRSENGSARIGQIRGREQVLKVLEAWKPFYALLDEQQMEDFDLEIEITKNHQVIDPANL